MKKTDRDKNLLENGTVSSTDNGENFLQINNKNDPERKG